MRWLEANTPGEKFKNGDIAFVLGPNQKVIGQGGLPYVWYMLDGVLREGIYTPVPGPHCQTCHCKRKLVAEKKEKP